MAQNPPLKENASKKVIYLDDAKKFDKATQSVVFAGAAWCGYSQMGAGKFGAACNDLENGKCYIADVTDPASASALKKLGANPNAFPDHFVWSPGEKKFSEIVGMRSAPELKAELSKKGFKF